MKQIFTDTIVLLNDLENMEMLLKKGIEFSVSHQVPLQVMYVHETPMFQMPDIFLSKEKRVEGSLDKEVVKQEIEKKVKALSGASTYTVFIYENDTLSRLSTLLRERKKVLVITQYEEVLLPKLVAKTPYAYCVVKEGKEHYDKVAIPADMHDDLDKCIETSQHLFINGKIDLVHDYRFMKENFMLSEEYMDTVTSSVQGELEVVNSLKDIQKEIFDAYLEKYNIKGTFLESDEVVYQDLIQYITANQFDLTLLYRNEKEILFSPSMLMSLMKKINTDFLVCPK
jgi:hypothetical protein